MTFFYWIVFQLRTVVRNKQNSRRKYWVTRSSVRSFARTAHSFACSGLLASLMPSAALTRSLARSLRSLPRSWEKWMIGWLFVLCFSILAHSARLAHLRIWECIFVIGHWSPLHGNEGSFGNFVAFQDGVWLQHSGIGHCYRKPAMILLLHRFEVGHVLKLVRNDSCFAVGKSMAYFLIQLLLNLFWRGVGGEVGAVSKIAKNNVFKSARLTICLCGILWWVS